MLLTSLETWNKNAVPGKCSRFARAAVVARTTATPARARDPAQLTARLDASAPAATTGPLLWGSWCPLVIIAFFGSDTLLASERVNVLSRCPYREVWRRCDSSNCGELKCHRPQPRSCKHDCKTGCFCGREFYRRRDGKCVYWHDCGD
ncbi:hypothetical protein V5799_026042 [Amblyomma americanum]|uniref:TIL domain-containing protein n=1 Tax=Amblyomma americanum TaxID=6943 RepID=A0AAQ4DJQ2_AMBAM